jgi:predicted ATPase
MEAHDAMASTSVPWIEAHYAPDRVTSISMPHLLRLSRKPTSEPRPRAFPFTIPAIATLDELDLKSPCTFFVGENGSGKSTLLEAIAYSAEIPAIGSEQTGNDLTLEPQRELGRALRLAWSKRSRLGFFMRAEDFFGHMRSHAREDARIIRELAEDARFRESGEKPEPAALLTDNGRHVDEIAAATWLRELDARSHGESFMDLFESRLRPGGLYLLDEPEAPLSPKRQLAFLKVVRAAIAKDAQFIIATHSPILLHMPGARIYSFDAAPIREVQRDALEHVTFVRDFLKEPSRYLDG